MAFRSLSSFIPTADELLALDLPRLGRILLLHLKSYEGLNTVSQNGRLNRDYFVAMLENRNVGLGPPSHREPEYGAKQSEVVRALTEAWNWLEREGLLIRDAEQPAAWFVISRRGEELLKNAGRFEQWERLGLERVKNDLMTGGTRVIGGTLEVQDLAWQWVRMKEGQATTSMDKTAATKSVHVDDLLARRRYVGADVAATSGTENAKMANESKTPGDKSRRVFVIHGRDERLRAGIFTFLRALGLEPIEWVKAIQLTGNASPYIGEILEAAFNHAQAAVVLLSPDDEARLRSDLLRPNDPPSEKELTGQARPNVLFEAGMAFASHPKQTVLVQFGEVRPFSDVAGRHIVRMDNSVGKRQEFAVKLRTAGCSVDTEGTDWHTWGDLTPAIENKGTIRDIYVNVETYDRVQLEPTSPPQRVSNIVSLRPLPASRRAIADDSDTWREVSDENGFLSAMLVSSKSPLTQG